MIIFFFFFQAEDGIRDLTVTGVQTCALPISVSTGVSKSSVSGTSILWSASFDNRSEEHTSELQSQSNLVCRLLLEKKTAAALFVARVPVLHRRILDRGAR